MIGMEKIHNRLLHCGRRINLLIIFDRENEQSITSENEGKKHDSPNSKAMDEMNVGLKNISNRVTLYCVNQCHLTLRCCCWEFPADRQTTRRHSQIKSVMKVKVRKRDRKKWFLCWGTNFNFDWGSVWVRLFPCPMFCQSEFFIGG